MKKICKFVFVFILLAFIGNTNVSASIYNGEGSDVVSGSGASCSSVSGPCMYNNANHLTVKVTLYWINGASYKKYYSEYWSNKNWGDKNILDKSSGVLKGVGNTEYAEASKKIKEWFKKNDWKNAKKWFKKTGESSYKKSEPAKKESPHAKKGYRIVIEPVVTYVMNGNSGTIYYDTIKNVTKIRVKGGEQRRSRYSDMLAAFYTNFTDVGIKYKTKEFCSNENNLETSKDYDVGCGMNIIDISAAIPPPDKILCPDDSAINKGMDITTCVENYVDAGQSEANAKSTCKDLYCTANRYCTNPITGGQVKITDCIKKYTDKKYSDAQAEDLCRYENNCFQYSCQPVDCVGKVQNYDIKNYIKFWYDNSLTSPTNATLSGRLDGIVSQYTNVYCNSCCMSNSIQTKTNNLKCTDDYNKKMVLESVYTVKTDNNSCDESLGQRSNYYGRFVSTTTGGCNVYCKDTFTLILPGNVKKQMKPGTSFEWPTSNWNDKLSSYRMKITINTSCTIVNPDPVGTTATCGSVSNTNLVNDYYSSYQNGATVNYTDEQYGNSPIVLSSTKQNNISVGTSSISMSQTSWFKLPANLNSWIDQTGRFFSTNNDANAVLPLIQNRKEGSLAISKNASGKYYLKLNLNLGIDNNVGSKITDYTCSYEVGGEDNCICPSSSPMAGENLDVLLLCSGEPGNNGGNSNLACLDAQTKLCYLSSEEFEEYKKQYENENYKHCTCEYNHQTVDLTDCFNSRNLLSSTQNLKNDYDQAIRNTNSSNEFRYTIQTDYVHRIVISSINQAKNVIETLNKDIEKLEKDIEKLKSKREIQVDYETMSYNDAIKEITKLETEIKEYEDCIEDRTHNNLTLENITDRIESSICKTSYQSERNEKNKQKLEKLKKSVSEFESKKQIKVSSLEYVTVRNEEARISLNDYDKLKDEVNKLIQRINDEVEQEKGKINLNVRGNTVTLKQAEEKSKNLSKEIDKYQNYASDDFEYCYNKMCNSVCNTDSCSWKSIQPEGTKAVIWKKVCANGEICETRYRCPGCPPEGECEDMGNPEYCLELELAKKGLTTSTANESQIAEALAVCEEQTCPYGGKKIVYRVIDLKDPFPGMTYSGKVTSYDTTNIGRFPGYNWRNLWWVQNKIHTRLSNNGTVEADNLYKDDGNILYTINLTPEDIKSIRNYNKEHSYTPTKSDYTCDDNTCVSSNFLRGQYKGILVGGNCSSTDTTSTLRSCYEKYSSSSTLATYPNGK